MASAPADLDAGLQAMLALKPPGVSGSRIASLTTLCSENVQSESILVQKLYTHFRKAPGSHKLGVLYVVDSVARKWTEQAKGAGQPINSASQDGTYAAGVHRVKELLPALMNDLISNAPVDQKEKIKKMIDIWEKGQTFPLTMLSSFRDKLNSQNASTTPPGSPPTNLQNMLPTSKAPSAAPAQSQAAASATPAPSTTSILAALANMARQNNVASPAPPPVLQASLPQPVTQPVKLPYALPPSQSFFPPAPPQPSVNHAPQFPPALPLNLPTPQITQQQISNAHNYASNTATSFITPPSVPPPASSNSVSEQQIMLAKQLIDQGLSTEQITSILSIMGSQGLSGLPPPPLPLSQPVPQPSNTWNGSDTRDRYDGMRSPPVNNRRRSRSPSPRSWNARDRRDDDVNDFRNGGRNQFDDRRGYRERSPPRRTSTPPRGGEKWIGWDESIGRGNIRVLSRTLFVGGVNTGEAELRRVFERYGRVQTCIINEHKRHAFVKMASRADAVATRDAMERDPPDAQLRTKWGVGFGPRECSDYSTGVSTIPIASLTDADRKWLLSAEFGGTGGVPIEQFMVIEEPDIEIGAGVSSKAISRRNEKATKTQRYRDRDDDNPNPKTWMKKEDKRGRRGGGGAADDEEKEGGGGGRRDRYANVSGPPVVPPVPSFGGGFPALPTLPNGMPMFPFFPGGQPPAPGR